MVNGIFAEPEEDAVTRYPNIADHGLIGDLQTAALVTTDGVLDWFCCPRFDSPSVFASLLDAERGGFYRIAPDRDDYVTRQLYLPDTAVLITRFMTPDGVGEVHDFMPVVEGPATNRHRLVRNIRVVRGVMRFAIEIQPRFDYGRKRHEMEAFDHGGVFRSEDMELTAHAIAPDGSTLRIGNGAADQLQLDIYGEAAGGMSLADSHGLQIAHEGWTAISNIMDWLCDNWDQPDEGIWETRGGRKNFTYGRFQVWVALDRAIRLAAYRGRPADIVRWTSERDAVYRQIMERGWNPKVGAFTQHYDTEVLDSSLLMMPLQGFIAPRDPMWLSTLAAMDRELVSDSLVYRYNPGASPDGLAGDEGTFSLCTFWYVEALARAGRLDDARLTFEKMHTYANHLGLYSEEIGSTGEQLGNFPQAFSHLSLISAAVNLDRQLDQGS
jgi:GH15 family glucan-1,4-alpha-glucosidase